MVTSQLVRRNFAAFFQHRNIARRSHLFVIAVILSANRVTALGTFPLPAFAVVANIDLAPEFSDIDDSEHSLTRVRDSLTDSRYA